MARKKTTKKKVDDRDIYAEWYANGGAPSSIARKMGATAAQVTRAIHEGITEYQQQSKGELSIADPLNLFGGRFQVTPFNPDSLVTRFGLNVFDDMRNDDQVKAALTLKKLTVIGTGFEIVSPEGKPEDWEVSEFVRKQLDDIDGSFQTCLFEIMTAFDYGYSVTEKVFDDEGGMINLIALKTRKPHSFDFKVDKHGNILDNGIWQRTGVIGRGTGVGGFVELPVDKFVVYTHQFEFGNHYGKSDLIAIYQPWWSKTNAYKFLMMVLERYGVPTILALYDPTKYSPEHVNLLFNSLKSMSATTMGVIPRSKPENLELWSPENMAKNARDVFAPVLGMFNQDISRGILMPSLLGFTPEVQSGSFARARVQFDVFMLVVEFLRSEITQKVMMDQIIKPLVDLNFATDVYPQFKFAPITADARVDILKEWREQVRTKSVKSTAEDENRVRSLLDFDMMDEDELTERNEEIDAGSSDDEDADDTGGDNGIETGDIEGELDRTDFATTGTTDRHTHEFDPGDVRTGPATSGASHTHLILKDEDGNVTGFGIANEHSHELISPEVRIAVEDYALHVDFARIEQELDRVEARGKDKIAAAITISRDALLKHVNKNFKLQSDFATSIKHLRKIDGIRDAVEEFLLSSYQIGRTTLRQEVRSLTNGDVKWFDDPNFRPADAINHLKDKALWITGVIDSALVEDTQNVLLGAVETGAPVRVTTTQIGALFDPFIGITVDGSVVTPFRLETIVRTNATDAFNQGRLVQARQAGPLLQGFEYSAVLDARTTAVCRFLDGKKIKPNDGNADLLKPPRHFNCRSILIPISAQAEVDRFITAEEVARGLTLTQKGF